MDRFKGRIGRRAAEKKEEVPKIVIDSPPEEIHVPYADSATPSTSSREGTAPIAVEEPEIEIVVEESDDAKENKGRSKDVEISKPESADPAGENANLLDDDDEDDESATSNTKQRRASLRRNSISLPNLDSLELQDIKDQHARKVKGVSVFN